MSCQVVYYTYLLVFEVNFSARRKWCACAKEIKTVWATFQWNTYRSNIEAVYFKYFHELDMEVGQKVSRRRFAPLSLHYARARAASLMLKC